MSFLTDYFNICESSQEVAVCCPFEHMTTNGIPYFETNPSASVNTTDNLFHCMGCQAGYSETQFIEKLLGCSYVDAQKIKRCFTSTEDLYMWDTELTLTDASKAKALSFGISEEVLTELHVKTPSMSTDLIAFPVFMYDHLADIRTYNPGTKPKVKSKAGSPAGLIIPYDVWRTTQTNKATILCAGEKDMAVARSNGLNAITLTGGEGATPKTLKMFTGRNVCICYDNDTAGIKGAKKVALALLPYANSVKIITGFHEICKEPGEDITDFFTKYNKTKQDLVRYFMSTPDFVPTEEDNIRQCPKLDLLTASQPQYLNRIIQSNIQVVAVSEASYVCPSAISAEKFKLDNVTDSMYEGDIREWEFSEDTAQDILHLLDNNFTEEVIKKNIRNILHIMQKERYVRIKEYAKKTVFKAYVTDMFETTNSAVQPMEYTAYSVGAKLESGKKYLATYKLVPHPYKGQQLTMIIIDAVQANDSVSNFKITDEVKQRLNVFRELQGNVSEKIETITEKVKGLLGYNGNNLLIQAIDLSYHTVLEFNFGSFKNVRGYLDTFIVGESRMGKSSTSDALRKTYGLGVFTSLAGNSATIPGLIGGSNKTNGTFQTRAGVIPQNHRGLLIFEEFGKCNANITRELTDIRSSNEVRITRVSGTMTMPANVRMITLTNVKASEGTIKPIASYPNGIAVITELVDTAEDIARYDMLVVLADRGNAQIDPFWTPQEPFAKEVYEARVRWAWSRTPEQIIISPEVGLFLMQQANLMNTIYDCHIKIFGTEAWKKIARLSIAVAAYLVSTDDSYENIIVTQEHVEYAVQFFQRLYDNTTFKLREYVEHERKFTTCDADSVANLQEIYAKTPGLVLQLEQSSKTSKPMLQAATGLNNEEINQALNRLTKGLFVRFSNHDILPTERFRLSLAEIERELFPRRVGEA